MITIRNVSHQIHKQTILHNINLTIPQGGITALIGANGAGKSTLLSFMARLKPLVSGSISYNGRDLAGTPTAQVAKMLAILCCLGVIPTTKGSPPPKTKRLWTTRWRNFNCKNWRTAI